MKLFGRRSKEENGDAKKTGKHGLFVAGNSPRAKGFVGEDMATAELMKRGYHILDRNYTTSHGEIDIVAELDGVIYFVEVKSRDVHNYFFPATSITDNKRYQIAGVAKQWFAEHGGEKESSLLVAEVYMDDGEIILFQDFLL